MPPMVGGGSMRVTLGGKKLNFFCPGDPTSSVVHRDEDVKLLSNTSSRLALNRVVGVVVVSIDDDRLIARYSSEKDAGEILAVHRTGGAEVRSSNGHHASRLTAVRLCRRSGVHDGGSVGDPVERISVYVLKASGVHDHTDFLAHHEWRNASHRWLLKWLLKERQLIPGERAYDAESWLVQITLNPNRDLVSIVSKVLSPDKDEVTLSQDRFVALNLHARHDRNVEAESRSWQRCQAVDRHRSVDGTSLAAAGDARQLGVLHGHVGIQTRSDSENID
mmetsp:Transcript_14270/g.34314  ORF Transcript_14270/g.34314 Transcript_14270/m.34314 type:complete len:277 (-) Transcript_14270:8300-9130(-)